MIYWNPELRRRWQEEGKSKVSVLLRDLTQEQLYSASTVSDFLEHKSEIPSPSNSYLGEFLKGVWVYVYFPSLKHDRINDMTGRLSDLTGEIDVTLEYLWENTGIVPDDVQNGGRLQEPIVAYSPKTDKLALFTYALEGPPQPETGKKLSEMFRLFSLASA